MTTDIANMTDAEHLRANAAALKSWFDSVSEQQRESMFWGRYSIEQRAADALDAAFRLALSAIHAMEQTASAIDRLAIAIAIDRLAIAMEARQGGDAEGGSVHDSAGAKPIAQGDIA